MRNEMSNVVHDHVKFTLESVRAASIIQMGLYDKYDHTNNDAAKAFLLDCLSSADLRTTVSERLEDDDSFHVVWMESTNAWKGSRKPSESVGLNSIPAKISIRCGLTLALMRLS
jgi:hypothetical protein